MDNSYTGTQRSESFAAAPAAVRRISWGAIFAGTVVAMVAQLALNLLGLGIGASTVNPTTEQNAFQGLGIAALIWMVLAILVSMFAGGWVAGRLAGMPLDLGLHGLVTFAFATLLMAFLLTGATGAAIRGTSNVVGQAISASSGAGGGGGQQADGQVYGVPRGESQGAVDRWLENQGIETNNPQAQERITQAAAEYAQALVVSDEPRQQRERQELIDTIAANTSMTEQEIERKVDELQRQAAQVGEQTAEGVAAGSIGAFVTLVLGAAAAMFGASLAAPRESILPRAKVDEPPTA